MAGKADTNSEDRGIDRRNLLGIGIGAAAALTTGAGCASAETGAVAAPKDGGVHLPARTIYPPESISEQAQKYLAFMADRDAPSPPPAEDKDAWRTFVKQRNASLMPASAPDVLPGIVFETRQVGEATLYVARRQDQPEEDLLPHLYIHGGGFTFLGGRICAVLTQSMALYYGGIVFGVDYRMPPDHPHPIPLDDCLACYRYVLETYPAASILLSGSSAGGNLAAALMHRIRDEDLPMPGALYLNTPSTDLTMKSDTLITNAGIDILLRGAEDRENIKLYAGDHDRNHPYLSPLYGEFSGFPPTYLRSGTRDLLLSDTVRLHTALRKAGVDADLYVHEAMPHSGFGRSSPEDKECRADTRRWLDKHWKPAGT